MNGEPVLEAHTLTIGRRASGILDKQIGTAARAAPNVPGPGEHACIVLVGPGGDIRDQRSAVGSVASASNLDNSSASDSRALAAWLRYPARPALVSGTQGEVLDPFKNAAGTSLSVMIAGLLMNALSPCCSGSA